ncbi:D-alanyl-D-alanine carboxypeptidase family protein [Flintibacter muris]|uniref:D-alanyl-D-alanine carboxypeptidase family protein n=1 Tax=Flintibacter muris TaxID=2941327 RepID=UPI00203D8DF1|nr:D-alanyl-D-alanine carboxypeptidase family protein [Flintibacter muris]
MKRLFSIVLTGLLLYRALPAVRAEGAAPPQISAASAVLMDAGTGRVLYEKDSHTHRLIASTTKLMTALVALESGHSLDETVTVASEWAGVEGSSIYLSPGEEISLEALLYGLLLRSGNDAALAIAGHCGGTVENFVAQMNRKAGELGMADSGFANPNGLDAEGHYSCAYDMALLAAACLENEELARIAATKSITLGTRTFTNHNKLLWRYEGCIGMKTGYTEHAGRTLVSAARRDGVTLICVTLNAPSDWADHTALFDYGFAEYQACPLTRTGERAGQLPVYGGLEPVCPIEMAEDLTAALSAGERAEVSYELTQTTLTAPVSAGTQVGEAVYYVNSVELARVPLVTGKTVPCDLAEPSSLLGKIWERITGL